MPGASRRAAASVSGEPIISLLRAGKTYPSPAHRAFGPVDLELHEGECAALAGRSGAGKSTLARCLAGLETLSEGVRLFHAENDAVGRRAVQLVFQDSPTAMNPAWTVLKILREPLALAGSDASPGRIADLLQSVGLSDDLLTRRPRQLSGGQRRRVALARALAVPGLRVLILDEPFAGLDTASAQALFSLLAALRKQRRLAILLITHDLGIVHRLAERLLIMAQGRLVEELRGPQLAGTAQHEASRALVDAILPEPPE